MLLVVLLLLPLLLLLLLLLREECIVLLFIGCLALLLLTIHHNDLLIPFRPILNFKINFFLLLIRILRIRLVPVMIVNHVENFGIFDQYLNTITFIGALISRLVLLRRWLKLILHILGPGLFIIVISHIVSNAILDYEL